MLEDLAAAVEVMVFPKHDGATTATCSRTTPSSCVKGRLDLRDDAPKLIAMEITRPELVLDGGPPVRVQVQARRALRRQGRRGSRTSSREHPGDSPVFVHLESPDKTTVLRLGDDYLVDAGNGLFAELRVLLGADCIA